MAADRDSPRAGPAPQVVGYQTLRSLAAEDLRSHDRHLTARMMLILGWVSVAAGVITVALPVYLARLGSGSDYVRVEWSPVVCVQPILNGLFALLYFRLYVHIRDGGIVSVWITGLLALLSSLGCVVSGVLIAIARGMAKPSTVDGATAAISLVVCAFFAIYCGKLGYHAFRVILFRGTRGGRALPGASLSDHARHALAPLRASAGQVLGGLAVYLAAVNAVLVICAGVLVLRSHTAVALPASPPAPVEIVPGLGPDPFRDPASLPASERAALLAGVRERSPGVSAEDLEIVDALLREARDIVVTLGLQDTANFRIDPATHRLHSGNMIERFDPGLRRSVRTESWVRDLRGRLSPYHDFQFINDCFYRRSAPTWKWTAVEREVLRVRDRHPAATPPQLEKLRRLIMDERPYGSGETPFDALDPARCVLKAPEVTFDAAGNMHYEQLGKRFHIGVGGELYDESLPPPAPRFTYAWTGPRAVAYGLIIDGLAGLALAYAVFRASRRGDADVRLMARTQFLVSGVLSVLVLAIVVVGWSVGSETRPVAGFWVVFTAGMVVLRLPELLVPYLVPRAALYED